MDTTVYNLAGLLHTRTGGTRLFQDFTLLSTKKSGKDPVMCCFPCLFKVSQRRHKFAFGSAVGATQIVDTEDPVLQKYQEFFYDNFEWAVIENALKWRLMEWTQVSYSC